jgi:nitrogen fixation NifU-like protein
MEYNKIVMKHFQHPKNMGEMKNPDGIGRVGNPKCGDVMEVAIKIKNNKIKEIKFKTFGCVAAIANSSVLTEIVKGMDLEKAKKITQKDILKKLGQMPQTKIHCSMLADQALKKAIKNYEEKYGK